MKPSRLGIERRKGRQKQDFEPVIFYMLWRTTLEANREKLQGRKQLGDGARNRRPWQLRWQRR
jgi:hypothetical protein